MQAPDSVSIVECPRDAMQGWKHLIPTTKKIEYLQSLLAVGFDTLDFGSFVSVKAIPQLADTEEVLAALDTSASRTELLAIVANQRGAETAAKYPEIRQVGYPFSVSETFQRRNANRSIAESLKDVAAMQALCAGSGQQLVVYLSMAFGNPYGDVYSPENVLHWAQALSALGIKTLSLADTVGLATAPEVNALTKYIISALPDVTVALHLHSAPGNRHAKLQAALDAGCRRFDGALRGIGGCPMAGDALVGNMDTEEMVDYFRERGLLRPLNEPALQKSLLIAAEIFSN